MEHSTNIVGKDGTPIITNTAGGHGYGHGYGNDFGVKDLLINQAVSDAARDGIRESARNGSDNIRETARVGSDLSSDISDLRSSNERVGGENRLSTAIASGEIRELVNKVGTDNLMASKDNGYAIREEGCKTREKLIEEAYRTREKSAEQHTAALLQACKDHAALTAQNAALAVKVDGLKEAICCCLKETTAGAEIKRLESALLDAKFAALEKDKGNS